MVTENAPLGPNQSTDGAYPRHLASGTLAIAKHLGVPFLLAATGLGMLRWTWGTWPDVLVDFGAQLYVPWQLATGKALYRDIAHYSGPLSMYFNATIFRLFGASLQALVFCNLVIAGLILTALYRLLLQISQRWAALGACLVFLMLFAFGQFTGCGNYNYICPYSHEMTHGVFLSLLSLLAIWAYPRYGLKAVAVSGLTSGLAFLTRSEIFFACAVGVSSASLMMIWAFRPGRKALLAAVAVFLGAATVPVTLAVALMSRQMPVVQALGGIMSSYLATSNQQLRNLPFYRTLMGIDDVGTNLLFLAYALGWIALVLIPAAGLSWAPVRNRYLRLLLVGVTGSLAVAVTYYFASQWAAEIFRLLSFTLLVCGAILLVQFIRDRSHRQDLQPVLRRMSFVVFSLALLGKMVLSTRIWQYGFVLAMPATMVLVLVLLDWIPRCITKAKGNALYFRAAATGWLLAVTAAYLGNQQMLMDLKTVVIAPGSANEFRADERGNSINMALDQLKMRARPGETLAALPEGTMLNFLSGRTNPTAYHVVLPTEVVLFGETQIVASFQQHPPDWIAYIDKDTEVFGYRFFGRDYCQRLDEWIRRRYTPILLIGDPPFQESTGFGIVLWRKADK